MTSTCKSSFCLGVQVKALQNACTTDLGLAKEVRDLEIELGYHRWNNIPGLQRCLHETGSLQSSSQLFSDTDIQMVT